MTFSRTFHFNDAKACWIEGKTALTEIHGANEGYSWYNEQAPGVDSADIRPEPVPVAYES